jgi:Domain of unknown function (DUF1707)
MTGDQAIRASDRDREHAAAVLRDAYTVGCLDLEELYDRLGAAYSARTWGDLHDLTADLPAWRFPGQGERDADAGLAPAWPDHAPHRPFAFIWVMAVVWLAIAAAAHSAAAATPLVLLSLFVLRAARWTVPPAQPPTVPAEHAQPTCCAARADGPCREPHGGTTDKRPRA